MLTLAPTERAESLTAFLQEDLRKDLLRLTTAGSVDDGKSTLIGRLLHDAKAVYEDQVASVRKSKINRSGGPFDFSLLTDGLRAEREQGITIDVAYRYFSTARRKFIIADTPGHEQYTRNMATGASTADVAVILVDGSKGLLPQTRRHAYISALLGIPNLVAAVNKMDLVDYQQQRFLALRQDFCELARSLGSPSVQCIPISALEGDNVVSRSANMPWYTGPTMIDYLESVEVRSSNGPANLRFPIQGVIRPDARFRGFSGTVSSGTIRPGDRVLALPSGQKTRVQAIVTYDGDLEEALTRQSVVLELEDAIDLSRGDLLVNPEAPPLVSDRFLASVVWLNAQPLQLNRPYLIKHSGRLLRARATEIRFLVNINDLTEHQANRLEMNEIASVEWEASAPLYFDPYHHNRATGSFILIDESSNATVGAAMIREALTGGSIGVARGGGLEPGVTEKERAARHGHLPAIFLLPAEAAPQLERRLFERGFEARLVRQADWPAEALPSVLAALYSAGMAVVCAGHPSVEELAALGGKAGGKPVVHAAEPSRGIEETIDRMLVIAERLRVEHESLNPGTRN